MRTSLLDPTKDFEINVGGTVRLLDALRCRAEPVTWEAGIARLAEWCVAEKVARAVEQAQWN